MSPRASARRRARAAARSGARAWPRRRRRAKRGPFVVDAGLLVCELVGGPVTSPDEEVDRGLSASPSGPPPRGDGRSRTDAGRGRRGRPPAVAHADAGVELEPRGRREVLIERLAHQLVDEGVAPWKPGPRGSHHVGGLVEHVEEPRHAEVGGLLERLRWRLLAAGDGRDAQRPDRVRARSASRRRSRAGPPPGPAAPARSPRPVRPSGSTSLSTSPRKNGLPPVSTCSRAAAEREAS